MMKLWKNILGSALPVVAAASLCAAEPALRLLDFSTGQPLPEPALRMVAEQAGLPFGRISPEKLDQLGAEDLLLVPESESFPASAVSGLDRFLKRGGRVIFTGGGRPFSSPAVRDGSGYITHDALLQRQKTELKGSDIGAIVPGMKYERQCDREAGKVAGSAKVSPGERVLRIHCSRFFSWDNWATPTGAAKIPAGTGMLRLRAKGDGKLPAFTVELREKDGSRWIATLPVGKSWEISLLPRAAFRYWRSNPKRGNDGDHVDFNQVVSVIFGISATHARGVRPGESYSYEIADLEALPGDPDQVESYPASFVLEGVAPEYNSYRLAGPVRISFADGSALDWRDGVVSPVPRMFGAGFAMNRPWRFIPVATARNAQRGRGYPVWIMLHLDRAYKGAAVAGMGFPLERILKTPELSEQLISLAKRLAAGQFLAAAGPEHFTADKGARVRYGAQLFRPVPGCMVRTRWIDPNGRSVSGVDGKADGNSVVTAEREFVEAGTWRFRAELVDASGVCVDRIDAELNIPESGADDPSEFVRVEGSDFMLGGKKWYPFGVNFYPVYSVAGMRPDDYRDGWGSRRFYDPAQVEEAILDAKAAGLNMLSVHPSDNQRLDPGAIRDFLYRCRKHGMKVNLFLGAASPVDFKAEELKRLIDAMRLPGDSTLFCYDIVWEASNFLFRADFREKFLPAWNLWVERSYGDRAEAVRDWKFDPGRGKNNAALRAPTDQELTDDGPHRIFVAAYRQFMDDHCARLWQRAADTLRSFDPNHLITNRGGNLSAYDNSLSGTVRALDFLSPEGYAIRHNRSGEGAVGFATRLAGYYSGGKPVVWSEFGVNTLGPGGYDSATNIQANGASYFESFYRRALESGANGMAPWWWPGGFRVNENSDFGITNVDGTLREAGKIAQRYSEPFRKARSCPAATVWFDYDRDAHAGGYRELVFGAGGDAYLKAVESGGMLGIRTPASGRSSVDVPIIGVGNVPYTGRNPVRYLNGAFDRVEYRRPDGFWAEIRDGQKIRHPGELQLRVRIGNGGEVPFKAVPGQGGVEIFAAFNGKKLAFPLEADLPRLEAVDLDGIVIPAEASGAVSLRFEARGRAVFGEHFRFELER